MPPFDFKEPKENHSLEKKKNSGERAESRDQKGLLFFWLLKKAKGVSGKRARIGFYSLAIKRCGLGFWLGRKKADHSFSFLLIFG